MVGHRPLDQDDIQSMMESGGLKPATLRKRQKVGEAFSKYNSENYGLDSIKTLLEGDKAQIEKSVTLFKYRAILASPSPWIPQMNQLEV